MSPDQPRDELHQIATELSTLARTGQVLPGSLQQRHTYCGKAGCACQADPPRPHGPYWQWTRKVAGKTITRRLTPDQIERYRPWIENDRRVHELLTRLEAIGIAHLEADQPNT
jgi:hypothetical protein